MTQDSDNPPSKFYDDYHINIIVKTKFMNFIQHTQNIEYIWSYNITIENNNSFPIQIISRYWQIIHANGLIEEINGEGVVGVQPTIQANSTYVYNSQVRLYTSSGIMHGYYKIRDDRGNNLKAEIEAFSLDSNLEPTTSH